MQYVLITVGELGA